MVKHLVVAQKSTGSIPVIRPFHPMTSIFVSYDYLVFIMFIFLIIFSVTIIEERITPTRPLPTNNEQKQKVRTTLQPNVLKSNHTLSMHILILFLLLGASLLFTTRVNEYMYISSQVVFQEYNWTYWLVLLWIILPPCLIVLARALLKTLSHDLNLPVSLLLLCAQFFYCLPNLFLLLVILECQGVILLLMLSTNQENVIRKSLHVTESASRLTTGLSALTAIIIQYWIGFFGAAILLFVSLWIVYSLGINQWQDLIYFLYFDSQLIITRRSQTLLIILLLASLFLKTGVFPFHFWKPELYNNLTLTQVFIYATPYTIATTLLVILILYQILLPIPATAKLLLMLNLLLGAYLLLSILFNVTEIRSFLAYTSGLHMLYIYNALIFDHTTVSASIFYNLVYYLATLAMFAALLHLKSFNIKYLTDFQLFTHLPAKIFWISIAFATMAGIPPLLGFWAKFAILFSLWAAAEYTIVAHLFALSLVYIYFYIAIYRFLGTTNFKAQREPTILARLLSIINVGLLAACLHLLGIWILPDLYNFASYWGLIFNDYH